MTGLEQVFVTNVQQNALGLDRVVHFERVSQVVNGTTANELDGLELFGRVEVQVLLLRVLVVLVAVVVRLVLVVAGLVGHHIVFQVAVQWSQLVGTDDVT